MLDQHSHLWAWPGGRTANGSFFIRGATNKYYDPLYNRGWVLQEEVLSSRALVFGHEQMSRRCFSLDLNEDLPDTEVLDPRHEQILQWRRSRWSQYLNPFGEITEAFLNVRGRLRRAILRSHSRQFYHLRDERYSNSHLEDHKAAMFQVTALDPNSEKLIGDVALNAEPITPTSHYELHESRIPRWPWTEDTISKTPIWLSGTTPLDRKNQIKGSSIWCLLVSVTHDNLGGQATCLALVPTNRQPDEFRRVGLLFLRKPTWMRQRDVQLHSSSRLYRPNSHSLTIIRIV